jgi:peptide/nickel transport system permease protein
MLRFVAIRLAMSVPTFLLVAVSVFLLIRLIPGDPAQLLLGDMADEASVAALRRSMGLDQSIPTQFLVWLGNLFRGDFGQSISTGQAILPLILERFWVSAVIVLVALALAVALALPAGILAAWKQNSAFDFVIVGTATILLSVPSFWVGLLLLLLFGLTLGWLPVIGFVPFDRDFGRALTYIIMPVSALVLGEVGVITRMVRASTLEVLRLDYITHARAKGLSEGVVLWRHAFWNAFAPTFTLIGLILGSLLGGIAVIETVFTIPGLGRLLVDAIFARDYPVIQGCMLFIACIYVVINLIVDLLYPIFDPTVTA